MFHQTLGTGDPYRDSPTITTPASGPVEEFPGQARATGLRRLSKLTWRATQLSAVTAVGFATLFARTAPTHTVSEATTAPSTGASASASPSGTLTHSAGHRHHRRGRAATPGVQPSAGADQAAAPTAGSSRSSGSPSAPSTSSSSSSGGGGHGGGGGGGGPSPQPTLAPPSSPPAPPPPPSTAPAPPPPPPTVSSTSHAGG